MNDMYLIYACLYETMTHHTLNEYKAIHTIVFGDVNNLTLLT